jgi:ankyrin repeat protein
MAAHNQTNDHGWIALHDAAHHGEIDNVKLFVEHDPSCVNVKDIYKRTSLHEAAYGEFPDKAEEYCKIVNFLLDNGSKIDPQDKDGFTPLHSAIRCGNLRIVKILVRRGADINKVDFYLGVTPFYIAVVFGHLEIIKYLLKKGASIDSDIGVSGTFQIRALHLASILPDSLNQGIDIFEYLLNENCDINARAKISLDFFWELTKYILSFPYVRLYPKFVEYFRKIISNFPAAELTAYDIASLLRNEKLLVLIEQRGGQSAGNLLIRSDSAKSTIGYLLRHYHVGYKNLVWPSSK